MLNALVFLEVTMSKINTIIFLFGTNGKFLGLASVFSYKTLQLICVL